MAVLKDDDKDLETTQADPDDSDDVEDKPDLPKDPIDKNESIEVEVSPAGTRQEKKQNRFRKLEEERIRAEERATAAERRAQEAHENYQRQLHTNQSQQRPEPSPVQIRLGQIAEAKRRLNETYQAVASQPGYDPKGQQQREFERQAEELENARVAAVVEARSPRIDEVDLARKIALNNYLNDHSDITQDATKYQWAVARWSQNIAEGQKDTKEMSDKVFDEARIKFGLQPRSRRGSRPDEATKRRLTGISAQASGGSAPVGKVNMNDMERKMAREMYDKDPPAVAYQKWANGPGKRAAEKRASK